MQYMTKALIPGKNYLYKGDDMGKLVHMHIAGAGGALRQEPYYELHFLKSNGVKANILADWDEKFIEVNEVKKETNQEE
jgi:hypothetical protein